MKSSPRTTVPESPPYSDTKNEIPMAHGALGGGDDSVCPMQMIEHTTYRPYTQVELVDLTNQFCQRPGKRLVTWLLYLWDLGVDSIMCSDSEMEKLASIMIHPTCTRGCRIV